MVGSISSNRAKGKICTLEIVNMKTVESFLKSLLLFIFIPIPWFYMEFSGRPHGAWNTWLIDSESSAKRQYAGSVMLMFNIWLGVVITLVFSVIVHVILKDSASIFYVDVAMIALNMIWVSLLSPKIALSYETWNWMKAVKFAIRVYETNHTKDGMVGKAVADYLVQEMVITKKTDTFKEFNHLENVLRALDLWKGQRKDIADRANKLE